MNHLVAFTLFVFLLSTGSSHGAPVLLAPTSTSPDEFEAALMSYSQRLSYIDHYLAQTPTSHSVELLAQRFSRAEQSFINSESLETALDEYKKVIELEGSDDWDEEQRRIFLLSYLRLLQITMRTDSRDRQSWIGKSLSYLRDIEAPRELIPPPVFRELEMKSSLYPPTEISIPKEVSRNYQKVLVQGRMHSTNKPIPISSLEDEVRWTFLSYFLEPKTVVTSPMKLKTLKIQSKALIAGECDQASLDSKRVAPAIVKIYRPLHCAQKKEKVKEVALPQPQRTPDSHWKMERRHWLWIGAGAVAAAIIASQLKPSPKSKDPVPTEAYGF